MTSSFDNPRTAEILGAVLAKNKGEKLSAKDIPVEVKCIMMLAFKSLLYQSAGRFMLSPDGHKLSEGLNTLLTVLCPEAFEGVETQTSPYNHMSNVFLADIQDLRNGRL